jgi:hypothetical protein
MPVTASKTIFFICFFPFFSRIISLWKCLIIVVDCFTEAAASVASMEATPLVVLDIMNYYQLLLTFILKYLLYINGQLAGHIKISALFNTSNKFLRHT